MCASSQSPLTSVSVCGENGVCSLAPPFPTQPASLGLRGDPISRLLRSPSAMGAAAPKPLPHSAEGRSIFIAIFHCFVKIIQRSKGRSAVVAAAERSGEKLTNEWDGEIHDYTHKGGIAHREIMLPAHAPPDFADRPGRYRRTTTAPTSGRRPGRSPGQRRQRSEGCRCPPSATGRRFTKRLSYYKRGIFAEMCTFLQADFFLSKFRKGIVNLCFL